MPVQVVLSPLGAGESQHRQLSPLWCQMGHKDPGIACKICFKTLHRVHFHLPLDWKSTERGHFTSVLIAATSVCVRRSFFV